MKYLLIEKFKTGVGSLLIICGLTDKLKNLIVITKKKEAIMATIKQSLE
jgi:hypothetical protein